MGFPTLHPPSDGAPAKSIRVLLVDDHQIMRNGLRLMLAQHPDMIVVGEAGDRRTALALTAETQPDVIVMDVGLPDADGVDLSREILEHWPEIRIVILSGATDQEHLDQALQIGVSGFLLKVNASEDLVRAIRTVKTKAPYLSPEVSAVLLTCYKKLRDTRQAEDRTALSGRELQILKLVADGRNTKDIAAKLSISIKTVETHRARLMTKLGLQSVADLTKYAIRMGYTTA